MLLHPHLAAGLRLALLTFYNGSVTALYRLSLAGLRLPLLGEPVAGVHGGAASEPAESRYRRRVRERKTDGSLTAALKRL